MSGSHEFDMVLERPWTPAGFGGTRGGHGVVLLEGEGGEPVLLATTADVRGFLLDRLAVATGSASEGEEARRARRGRADLREVTARVRVAQAGSRFEAEWRYLGIARASMPREYRALLDRWKAWFIHVDLSERIPQLRKIDLVRDRDLSDRGTLLGPVRDKDAAGRLLNALTDIFDLCREERLLLQAPNATACPYKEMGRCRAPCDGSESLKSYRARVAEAVRFAAARIEEEAAAVGGRMRAAAAALDFEEAERLKKRLERMKPLRGRAGAAFSNVSAFAEAEWMIVGRSEREGWQRLFGCFLGFVEVIADFSGDADDRAFEELAATARRRAEAVRQRAERTISIEQREGMALLCRWLNTGEKCRGVKITRMGPDGFTGQELAAMARGLGRIAEGGTDEGAMELEAAGD